MADTDITTLLANLAKVLGTTSGSLANNQNANTQFGISEAALRPTIVGKNAANARRADMVSGMTDPSLNWGGPGSVVKNGAAPTPSGGPGAPSASTQSLESLISQDALTQAQGNYGLPNPSASSGASTALGAAGIGASLLSVLQKAGLLGGGSGNGTGSSQGDGSTPITSGDFDAEGNWIPSSGSGGPSNVGGAGDLSHIDPNGTTATGDDEIAQLLALLGPNGGAGSDRNKDGTGDPSNQNVGFF